MKAVVTGVCGMDGSHMADLLVEKGDECIGVYRRSSRDNFSRIDHVKDKIRLEEGDICDAHYMSDLIGREKPDVVFNTAAQSHVGTSFKQPALTIDVNLNGVVNILEAIRNRSKDTRLIQCSTSEMWGNRVDPDRKQRETTPFAPTSPYAVSKMAAYDLCKTYRKAYGIFACSTICHNHTSPRRGDNFVEKKIINWVKANEEFLYSNLPVPNEAKLVLGNINTTRDFGHSKDYVSAMYAMSKMSIARDYVVATGVGTSIKELLDKIFKLYNRDYKTCIRISEEFYRPSEVDYLCGDSSLIQKELGWKPEYTIDDIIKEMLYGC